ncbi:lytic polysaccharide monooxygenase [Skeletonema marinoi]|uniref:Lytic polysaccharide monooxygenase n=1 Tax=Skeletonema marinoi TaxID=267567 RepID=A0AAD9D5D6_9STRA|nr:lytic polysaccharide monooxygenase [Skeletonema marinoi]
MLLSRQLTAAAIAVIFTSLASNVHGHGHLVSPRSRNYVAKQDGAYWPADETTSYPEDCPHCLNVGGTEASCGLTADRNYDYPKNALGGNLAPAVQACYAGGDVVELDVVLTAHHMGHFSYKACAINAGEVASQECFDSNPLTFVEDVLYGSLPDPNYPNRAYIPRADSAIIQKDNSGDYKFSHRFKLPEGLSGELVLLQWHYLTGNSCMADEGYLNYNFPAGFEPNLQLGVCNSIPSDGRGVPEQFWNCAEIRISSDCASDPPPPSPPTTPPPPQTTTQATTTTGATTTTTTTSTTTNVPPPAPSSCPAENNACGPNNPCSNGMCCSQWGYCGNSEGYCGECCQSNCDGQPPSPPSPSPPTPSPPTSNPPPSPGFNYDADHGEDSRLIAYVGNWQACPTDEQIDAYSHIVIAFAVSYTWSAAKNNCDAQCQVPSSLPLCGNQARPDLIEKWRGMGKKVIMSFGGAGMGGSWSGDQNNCWDYCFGREDKLSTDLVSMIEDQNLDGVDIDYEYCYDVAGKQAGRCAQRSSLYTDEKAQLFLNSMTSLLRTKLDVLQASNGYSRGRYEITHAPMDADLVPSNGHNSKYFDILHDRRADLDFLMPQFYNGYTRAGLDGFDGTGAGSIKASTIYSSLANEMFDNEPNKVVFGHCISDCSGTGSNVNANQAVQIQQEIKEFNNGEFACNGGAFFWVATHDAGGGWSDQVVSEVSLSAGCSNSQTTSSTVMTTTTTTTTVTPAPSEAPTSLPTPEPTTSMPTSEPTSVPTTSLSTVEPTAVTPAPSSPPTPEPATSMPTSEPTPEPTTPMPTSEPTPESTTSMPTPIPSTPTPTQEPTAMTPTPTPTLVTPSPTSGPTSQPTPLPTTSQPTGEPTAVTPAPSKSPQATLQPTTELVVNRENRCGQNELQARETCGNVCQSVNDCGPGEYCWGVHPNYCGSIPKRVYVDPVQSTVWTRCGKSELDARSFCGEPCTWECAGEGETCQPIHANYCDSEYYIE